MVVQGLCRSLPSEGLARPVVEGVSDCGEVVRGPPRQVGSLGKVLAQQAVDASMSSRGLTACDVVGPGLPVGVHGPVDHVDEMSLQDAASTSTTFGRRMARQQLLGR